MKVGTAEGPDMTRVFPILWMAVALGQIENFDIFQRRFMKKGTTGTIRSHVTKYNHKCS